LCNFSFVDIEIKIVENQKSIGGDLKTMRILLLFLSAHFVLPAVAAAQAIAAAWFIV
jgi:hypothetical protein